MAEAHPTLPVVPRCMCPRCGYDVQGDADRWNAEPAEHAELVEHAACPLEGTCPECGFRFSWAAVMRPGLVSPVWFVETNTAFGRKRWSGVRTLVRACTPWRFWREVTVETPSNRLRRLLWLGLATISVAIAGAVAMSLVNIVYGSLLALSRSQYAPAFSVADLGGWGLYPFRTMPRALASVVTGSSWYRCVWVGAIAYPVMMLVLSQSRKQAKVRPEHVLRAAIYALAIFAAMLACGFVLELAFAIGQVVGLLPSRWMGVWWTNLSALEDLVSPNQENHFLYPVVIVWFAVWWAFAIRSWRMRQAWQVWLAVVIPSTLVQLVAVIAGHLVVLRALGM